MSAQDESKTSDILNRYLSFHVDKQEYAVELLSVREVIAPPEVTPVPFASPYLLGIMNLRGQILSVIDMRLRLGLKPNAQRGSEAAVIVFRTDLVTIGALVDSVNEVRLLSKDKIAPKPTGSGDARAAFVSGVVSSEKSLCLIMDLKNLLSQEEKMALAKASGEKAVA